MQITVGTENGIALPGIVAGKTPGNTIRIIPMSHKNRFEHQPIVQAGSQLKITREVLGNSGIDTFLKQWNMAERKRRFAVKESSLGGERIYRSGRKVSPKDGNCFFYPVQIARMDDQINAPPRGQPRGSSGWNRADTWGVGASTCGMVIRNPIA